MIVHEEQLCSLRYALKSILYALAYMKIKELRIKELISFLN